MIDGFLNESLIGKARQIELVDIDVHDLRSYATGPHRSVDDSPFGGGAGMVMAPQPVFDAVEQVNPPRPLLLLSPGGQKFDQAMAVKLAELEQGFSLLCGRYEGVDQRIVEHLVDGEVSVGDYVLAGGEAGALVVIEAVCRLMPGVLGNADSISDESFIDNLLEYPQYTRPAGFRGWEVPAVLTSGDHALIGRWRKAQALARTLANRPDLIDSRGGLSANDQALLEEFGL